MAATSYQLDVGLITLHDSHTYELIPHEGEINDEDIKGYLDFIEAQLIPPYRVLFNNQNHSSYSFAAQRLLMAEKQPAVYAIIMHSKAARYSFEDIFGARKIPPKYAFFEDPSLALAWLLAFPLEEI